MSAVILLGEGFGEAEEEGWRKRVASTLWFTYRCSFAEMAPFGYTDDAGWGCCLRSSQMLMAEALSRHVGSKRRHDVVRWFFDKPGETWKYSIHNMTRCGTRYDVMPGEWYGPGIAAHVLRDLCEMHDHDNSLGMNMMVTSTERPLCEEDVFEAATARGAIKSDEENDDDLEEEEEEVTRTEEREDPLLCPPRWARRAARRAAQRAKRRTERLNGPWLRATFVVVPLRLGLHKVEEKYVAPLLACLGFPQSVGFVGGRPRQALYFVGHLQSKHLIGLDPHVVQPANIDLLSAQHLDSLVCVSPRKVPVDAIDPSLALGFYCRDRESFLDLTKRLKDDIAPLSSPPLFEIIQKRHVDNTGQHQQWDSDNLDDSRDDGLLNNEDDDDDSEYVVV